MPGESLLRYLTLFHSLFCNLFILHWRQITFTFSIFSVVWIDAVDSLHEPLGSQSTSYFIYKVYFLLTHAACIRNVIRTGGEYSIWFYMSDSIEPIYYNRTSTASEIAEHYINTRTECLSWIIQGKWLPYASRSRWILSKHTRERKKSTFRGRKSFGCARTCLCVNDKHARRWKLPRMV